MSKKVVFGGIETVSVPAFGLDDVIAKIDTGAWSGALHCTDIVEHDGRLYFNPLGRSELRTSVTDYSERTVRAANGREQRRYRIPLELEIQGRHYRMVVGLSDRRRMHYEMLIGRRFLLGHAIVVDVSRTREVDYEAKEDL